MFIEIPMIYAIMNMREQFYKAPYKHLIKKLSNTTLSESEEYDI